MMGANLKEIVKVTLRNRRGQQFDLYNRVMEEKYFDNVCDEVVRTIISYHTKDLAFSKILDLAEMIIQRWEVNLLGRHQLAYMQEYGM